MTEYVLGFAFTRDYADFDRVLLIRKTKPEWQAGRLNGIGGKIEPGDFTPHRAMSREFAEEAGLETLPSRWTKFAVLEFPACRVHCFTTWFNWKEFKKAAPLTEELLESYQLDSVFDEKMKEAKAISNLRWLILMARAAWSAGADEFPVLRIADSDDSKYAGSGVA